MQLEGSFLPNASVLAVKNPRNNATWKPWLTDHQLILKGHLLTVLLRQQQPPGKNLEILSANVNFSYVFVGLDLKSMTLRWNICSKLVRDTFFFQNTSVVLFISKLSQTHFDDPRLYKDARPTYSCLKINLCFGPSYLLKKFGHGVSPNYVFNDFFYLSEGNMINEWRLGEEWGRRR